MFAIALIVFRESLEAALLLGIVAAATQALAGRWRWLGAGVAIGTAGALGLAFMAGQISAWLDGVGQDVVNIAVLSAALAMLLWHCIWVGAHARETANTVRQMGQSAATGNGRPWPLLVAVALVVLREGAEAVLFVSGAMVNVGGGAGSALVSAGLGLGAGLLAGAVLYAGLARIPLRHVFSATNVLIALLAGSLASQLARALAQAGLFETGSTPLWDSSHLLAQNSVLGTVLHALAGYDAQPSAAQLAFYVTALGLIASGTWLLKRRPA